MQDIYLSFKDEKEANAILFNGVIPNYQNIDVIGVMYEPISSDFLIGDSKANPVPLPSPNYGVNIRLLDHEDSKPLKPYLVYPANPMRVWS